MNPRLQSVVAFVVLAPLCHSLQAWAQATDCWNCPKYGSSSSSSSSSGGSSSSSGGTSYRSTTYSAPAPAPRPQPNYGAAAAGMLGLIGEMMESSAAAERQNALLRQQQERQREQERIREAKRQAEEEHRILKQREEQNKADQLARQREEEARIAKDNLQRQALANPFAAGSADEADWDAVKSRRFRERAEANLNACRRKANARPGLDNDTVCVAEQAEVRKYQQYHEGWMAQSLDRSARENAPQRERERRMLAAEEARRANPRQMAAVETDAANPFEPAKSAYSNARDTVKGGIQNVKDKYQRAKDCFKDPFSEECAAGD